MGIFRRNKPSSNNSNSNSSKRAEINQKLITEVNDMLKAQPEVDEYERKRVAVDLARKSQEGLDLTNDDFKELEFTLEENVPREESMAVLEEITEEFRDEARKGSGVVEIEEGDVYVTDTGEVVEVAKYYKEANEVELENIYTGEKKSWQDTDIANNIQKGYWSEADDDE